MDLNKFYAGLDMVFKTQDVNAAEKYILEHLEQVQREGDIAAILAVSNELGGIYRVTSRFEEGKSTYEVALGAIKLLGLESTEQHGTTLLNMATIYAASKDSREALNLYEQAADIFEKNGLNKDYRMAAVYNNISHVYEELQDYISAALKAEKALGIIQTLPNAEVELATTYTTIANIYVKQKRDEEAERYLYMAEKIYESQQGKKNVHYGATLNSLGEFYYNMKNYPLSLKYFEKSLELVKENYGESNLSYVYVCKNLAFVCAAMGQLGEKASYERAAEVALERINKV